MSRFDMTSDKAGHLSLQGELTFASIDRNTLKKFAPWNHDKTDSVIIDLRQITKVDSAGLALLVEWLKVARKQKTVLLFENIPEQLQALARLCGFEQLLQPGQPHR